jgi:hypothetical protein
LRLSKHRSKLAGKLWKTCLQPRGELGKRLRGSLHLDRSLNPNVNLNPSLYREMLARSYFSSVAGLYSESYTAFYLLLYRELYLDLHRNIDLQSFASPYRPLFRNLYRELFLGLNPSLLIALDPSTCRSLFPSMHVELRLKILPPRRPLPLVFMTCIGL